MSTTPREVNRLSDDERFTLYDELKQAQPEIDRDKLTPAELAERLTKRLGFQVSKANIKKIAQTVKLRFPDSGKTPYSTLFKTRIDTLETRLKSMEGLVFRLYENLGQKIPGK